MDSERRWKQPQKERRSIIPLAMKAETDQEVLPQPSETGSIKPNVSTQIPKVYLKSTVSFRNKCRGMGEAMEKGNSSGNSPEATVYDSLQESNKNVAKYNPKSFVHSSSGKKSFYAKGIAIGQQDLDKKQSSEKRTTDTNVATSGACYVRGSQEKAQTKSSDKSMESSYSRQLCSHVMATQSSKSSHVQHVPSKPDKVSHFQAERHENSPLLNNTPVQSNTPVPSNIPVPIRSKTCKTRTIKQFESKQKTWQIQKQKANAAQLRKLGFNKELTALIDCQHDLAKTILNLKLELDTLAFGLVGRQEGNPLLRTGQGVVNRSNDDKLNISYQRNGGNPFCADALLEARDCWFEKGEPRKVELHYVWPEGNVNQTGHSHIDRGSQANLSTNQRDRCTQHYLDPLPDQSLTVSRELPALVAGCDLQVLASSCDRSRRADSAATQYYILAAIVAFQIWFMIFYA
ncbi:uncharacterized protein LOC131957457 isoform X2 [Physella acuta]|uniref:uncharacterized protein LOC131957457 isoform X2 n=1 Tax=Physella acuta TaxID=109671 RepID=UPI0027DBEC19|nr:uncharacterized protein LOC131957457 isoform X2 [Physella acuta]